MGGLVAPLAAAFVVVFTAMAVAAPVCSTGADGITLRHVAQGIDPARVILGYAA